MYFRVQVYKWCFGHEAIQLLDGLLKSVWRNRAYRKEPMRIFADLAFKHISAVSHSMTLEKERVENKPVL